MLAESFEHVVILSGKNLRTWFAWANRVHNDLGESKVRVRFPDFADDAQNLVDSLRISHGSAILTSRENSIDFDCPLSAKVETIEGRLVTLIQPVVCRAALADSRFA